MSEVMYLLANSFKTLRQHTIQVCWSVPNSMLKLLLYLFFPVVLHLWIAINIQILKHNFSFACVHYDTQAAQLFCNQCGFQSPSPLINGLSHKHFFFPNVFVSPSLILLTLAYSEFSVALS